MGPRDYDRESRRFAGYRIRGYAFDDGEERFSENLERFIERYERWHGTDQ